MDIKHSKSKVNDYLDKIKELFTRLAPEMLDDGKESQDTIEEQNTPEVDKIGSPIDLSSGLRKRFMSQLKNGQTISEKEINVGAPIGLDATTQVYIGRHRKVQADLTDEMAVLARQLNESSLLMNQSVQETEKILASTERAVEHSFAGTRRANARAVEVYSLASKTTCFQWLPLFLMTCMFFMVVILIRIT